MAGGVRMDAPPIRRMVVPIDNLTSVLDKVSLIRHLQSLSNRDRDAWFVWDKAVGDDASHEVDHEVGDRAMTGVLDLAQVFQLVKDGFDDAALAQGGLIELGQGHRLHVFAHLGYQTNAALLQSLGEPFVGIEGAKQAVAQLAQRLVVIALPSVSLMASSSPTWLITPGSLKHGGKRGNS